MSELLMRYLYGMTIQATGTNQMPVLNKFVLHDTSLPSRIALFKSTKKKNASFLLQML